MAGTFVSIGNALQAFPRLLDEVARLAPGLPQPVIVQRGRTDFAQEGVEVFDFTDEEGFQARLAACELFITHGGGGSVFAAIRAGKRPVVVPRLRRCGEVIDDHQVGFAHALEAMDAIVTVFDVVELADAARRALATPPAAQHRDRRAPAAVRESLLVHAPGPGDGVLLVSPSGGHLSEIRELADTYSDRPHHFVINTPIVQPAAMQGRTNFVTPSSRDWRILLNVWEAFRILRRLRPSVILTTGGGFSVAFALMGRLLGVPTVYVETVAKVTVPTVTGRAMYWLADRFFFQWPGLARHFPRGEYIGLVL